MGHDGEYRGRSERRCHQGVVRRRSRSSLRAGRRALRPGTDPGPDRTSRPLSRAEFEQLPGLSLTDFGGSSPSLGVRAGELVDHDQATRSDGEEQGLVVVARSTSRHSSALPPRYRMSRCWPSASRSIHDVGCARKSQDGGGDESLGAPWFRSVGQRTSPRWTTLQRTRRAVPRPVLDEGSGRAGLDPQHCRHGFVVLRPQPSQVRRVSGPSSRPPTSQAGSRRALSRVAHRDAR